MPFLQFEDLEIWKQTRSLKNELFILVKTFPIDEKYRLADQMIRSIRSVNASIAEGNGRRTAKDRIHFCIISRGSLSETLNHLIDAFDCNYINESRLNQNCLQIKSIEQMLNAYIRHLHQLT